MVFFHTAKILSPLTSRLSSHLSSRLSSRLPPSLSSPLSSRFPSYTHIFSGSKYHFYHSHRPNLMQSGFHVPYAHHSYRKFSTKMAARPPSILHKFLSVTLAWKKWIAAHAVHATLPVYLAWATAIGTLLPLTSVIYTYYAHNMREQKLMNAFNKGAVPEALADSLVERPGVSKEIVSLLQPPADYDSYDMIVGYHGTGKTTLVRHVGHQIAGIIYVDVTPKRTSDEAFTKALAEALSWSPKGRSGFEAFLTAIGAIKEDKISYGELFTEVFDDFFVQAQKYKEKTGRPPVLVLDNVNRLALWNPELLHHLQEIAKDAADDRRFVTLFVTSEGLAPIQMFGRSALSRLGDVLVVEDLSHSEVADLLCSKHGISAQQMEDIYGLVGGRIKLLKKVIKMLGKGEEWRKVEKLILARAYKNLDKAQMLKDGKFRDISRKISQHILKQGYITGDDLRCIVPSIHIREELLSLNVFSSIPDSDQITFHSKPTEIVAQREFQEGKAGLLSFRFLL